MMLMAWYSARWLKCRFSVTSQSQSMIRLRTSPYYELIFTWNSFLWGLIWHWLYMVRRMSELWSLLKPPTRLGSLTTRLPVFA